MIFSFSCFSRDGLARIISIPDATQCEVWRAKEDRGERFSVGGGWCVVLIDIYCLSSCVIEARK